MALLLSRTKVHVDDTEYRDDRPRHADEEGPRYVVLRVFSLSLIVRDKIPGGREAPD